ncbi:uncharacterized protein LOC105836745 [Monomorium pharaonis]|uniref:uncharacterized protein LOC105836745 n=1 Tax=Monomorium pharaonis TaxID=307658 RepID=UPI00063EE547|nr:uncharacterized protein LOC105836745 [Monomorium pharaonis]
MESDREEIDISINIQRTLTSINDVCLKIKKELQMIDELVKENGHLHTVVNTANQILSKKVQEMGMNVAEVISESERNDRLDANLLGPVTSTIVTEELDQIGV